MDNLISLVEQMPVMWDKTTENYKDRNETGNAWKEIFMFLLFLFLRLYKMVMAITRLRSIKYTLAETDRTKNRIGRYSPKDKPVMCEKSTQQNGTV
nr:unnamed protein product [Callosobruchus analis]